MLLRPGTLSDIPDIERIARQYHDELGFVRRISLERAVNHGELLVAECAAAIVGYVEWHNCQDGWSTVYSVAVDKAHVCQGIGINLLWKVPRPVRLKCPVDSKANTFYSHNGFELLHVEAGRKRALNHWIFTV